MAFADLDNPKPSGGRRCPPGGVMVSQRESGPAGKRSCYVAILIGPDLAKALNFHSNPTMVRVGIGNGNDEGKLRIIAATGGQFPAKKQKGGGWLVTIRSHSMPRAMKPAFERFTIDRARHVPANAGEGPCTIIPFSGALA